MKPNHNDVILAYLSLAFVLLAGVILVIVLHLFF